MSTNVWNTWFLAECVASATSPLRHGSKVSILIQINLNRYSTTCGEKACNGLSEQQLRVRVQGETWNNVMSPLCRTSRS